MNDVRHKICKIHKLIERFLKNPTYPQGKTYLWKAVGGNIRGTWFLIIRYLSFAKTLRNPWPPPAITVLKKADNTSFVTRHYVVKEEENSVRVLMLCQVLCLLLIAVFWSAVAQAEDNSCFYCGMYQSKFEHSWVTITHEDGSRDDVCSIHCAAIDMALHTDRPIRMITVGDFDTKKQIDANDAYWVIGGDIMGVMTVRAKWAFETKDRADSFMKVHGGRSANLREVIKLAFEDMYQDTLMIHRHRKLINLRKKPSQ